MDEGKISIAANQWNIPRADEPVGQVEPPPTTETIDEKSVLNNSIKKRGFFEAISYGENANQKLDILLRQYQEQTSEKITTVTYNAEKRIHHLTNRIDESL